MAQEWIDPTVDPVGHMTKIRYPLARKVIGVLKSAGVRALHVGSPVFDPWRPPGVYFFGDLDLLIQESDLAAFRNAMEGAGYRFVMDNPHEMASTIAPDDVVERMLTTTAGPGADYADPAHLPAVWFWTSFQTTWRHGTLTLADLGHWFDPGESDVITVMGDTEIERPPIWGLLLWQAAVVNTKAAGHIYMKEVDRLHMIASRPQVDWDQALSVAQRYETEFQIRNARLWALVDAELRKQGLEPQPQTPLDVELGLGVLYDMRYAFEALEDFYPGTVPQSFLQGVRTGSGLLRRKIIGYRDSRWVARYGLEGANTGMGGFASFSIREQIEKYPDLRGTDFFDQGIVTPVITDLPPHGLPVKMTEKMIQQIFAPV